MSKCPCGDGNMDMICLHWAQGRIALTQRVNMGLWMDHIDNPYQHDLAGLQVGVGGGILLIHHVKTFLFSCPY